MKRKSIPTSEAQLREFIAAGMSRKQIAEKLQLDQGRLATALTVLGITTPPRRAAVSVNAHDAVALLLRGLTLSQIGAALKVHPATVRSALVGAKLPTNLRAAVLWSEKQKAKTREALRNVETPVAGLAV